MDALKKKNAAVKKSATKNVNVSGRKNMTVTEGAAVTEIVTRTTDVTVTGIVTETKGAAAGDRKQDLSRLFQIHADAKKSLFHNRLFGKSSGIGAVKESSFFVIGCGKVRR